MSRAWSCPDRDKVRARHYEAWDRPPLVVDTAHRSVEACVADILRHLPGAMPVQA
ncbi:hypothetical protein [Fulvimonas soli]|jgi:hypothetical protein|uniref:Uncharacterized protein n=1 Tax=Fulvimonas soli TaxID=155197 RepID=A0A316IGY8_9GAMM|nr:hypothetical protein [Fulvimonas soli]PWK92359.1 hypothetical protein C7456_10292 [Fulvimonas soli]